MVYWVCRPKRPNPPGPAQVRSFGGRPLCAGRARLEDHVARRLSTTQIIAIAAALLCGAGTALAEPEMSVRETDQPIASSVPPDVAAQHQWPSELPAPDSLFERHVEICGGADAILKSTTRLIRGTIVNDTTGYRAVLNTYQEAPDKLWLEFRQPGVGKQTIVFDGDIAWVSSGGPPVLLGGNVLRDLQLSADFYGDGQWRERYLKLETVDFGLVENEPVARVAYETHIGKNGVHAFSLESGRIIATQTYSAGAEGDELLLILLKDYNDAEGYLLPTRILQKTDKGLTETRYRQVIVNAEKPDRVSFDRPPEVVKQLEEARARIEAQREQGENEEGEG